MNLSMFRKDSAFHTETLVKEQKDTFFLVLLIPDCGMFRCQEGNCSADVCNGREDAVYLVQASHLNGTFKLAVKKKI